MFNKGSRIIIALIVTFAIGVASGWYARTHLLTDAEARARYEQIRLQAELDAKYAELVRMTDAIYNEAMGVLHERKNR